MQCCNKHVIIYSGARVSEFIRAIRSFISIDCYRIRDVTVLAILIQISFKLIHDIDRIYLNNNYVNNCIN